MSTNDTPAPVVYARKSQPSVVVPEPSTRTPAPAPLMSENTAATSSEHIDSLAPMGIIPPADVIRPLDPSATLTAIANNLFLKNENEFPINSPQQLSNPITTIADSKTDINKIDKADESKGGVPPAVVMSATRRSIPPKKQVFRPYNCSNCPQKAFRSQEAFEAHICNPDPNLPQYRCRFCNGSTFLSESEWEDHEKVHGEQKIVQGEILQKRKPSIGKKFFAASSSASQNQADSGLPLKKRGRPAKPHTPTQAPTAKTQPQKKKVTEKLPRTIYKKTVAPSPKLDTQSPISNGTTNNVQIKEPKTPVSIVATPVPNSETTSPVTPSSGQRSQRIRVPPKWCENMIMEYEVTGTRTGKSPASTPTATESKEKPRLSLVITKSQLATAAPAKRSEKSPISSKASDFILKARVADKGIKRQETKPTHKVSTLNDEKSQSGTAAPAAAVITKSDEKSPISSEPPDLITDKFTTQEETKPIPKIPTLIEDKSQSAVAVTTTKLNDKTPISSADLKVNIADNGGIKQEEAKPAPKVLPVVNNNKSQSAATARPALLKKVLLNPNSEKNQNQRASKPPGLAENISGGASVKPDEKKPTPKIPAPISGNPRPTVAPVLNKGNEKNQLPSKPEVTVGSATCSVSGVKQEEVKLAPKMPSQNKVAKAETILPAASDALHVGPTTRKRKLEDNVAKPCSVNIPNVATNGASAAKSPKHEPAKRAKPQISDKPMTQKPMPSMSPIKNSMPKTALSSSSLTEIKNDTTTKNGDGAGLDQGIAINGFSESPAMSAGSSQSSFIGMPRLLNQSGIPILDDSDISSEDEDPNLPASATASNCSSSRPYIKDVAIRFLEQKISNRNMLRIREELMTLKQGGNYFRLTKTAPLAAGLVHDMFCQSFGTHDPQDGEEMQ